MRRPSGRRSLALLAAVAVTFASGCSSGPSGPDGASPRTDPELTPAEGALPPLEVPSTAPPAPAPGEGGAPDAAPRADLRDVDFANRTYEIDCQGEVAQIEVVDGRWVHPDGPTSGSLDQFEVSYGDVTGDGREDAVVTVACSVGAGSNWWGTTSVFEASAEGAEPVGAPIPSWTWLRDGELVGEVPEYQLDDPMCCPSTYVQSRWSWDGRTWVEQDRQQVPVERSLTASTG